MPAVLYQSESLPAYVPLPLGNDSDGTHWHTDMFVPRLPLYRRECYAPIMQAIDPAALSLAGVAPPGQGPDSTGQNWHSDACVQRFRRPTRECYAPIEQPIDPDAFAVGQVNTLVADPMFAPRLPPPRAKPPHLQRIDPAALAIDDQPPADFLMPSMFVPRVAAPPRRPLPVETRSLFWGTVTDTPITPMFPMMARAPITVRAAQQATDHPPAIDVSSTLWIAPTCDQPLHGRRLRPKAAIESADYDLATFRDAQPIGWWTPLARPVLPAPPRQPGEQTPGQYDPSELGSTAAAGFVSPPLAVPVRTAPRPIVPAGERLDRDPGSAVPNLDLSSPTDLAWRRPPAKILGETVTPEFTDLSTADWGELAPLAVPVRLPPRRPTTGETRVELAIVIPPPLIVGCDLYTAVPVRPRPAGQSNISQAIATEPPPRADGMTAAAMPALRPRPQPHAAGPTPIDAPPMPLVVMSQPMSRQPYRPPVAGQTPPPPATFQVLGGLDSMAVAPPIVGRRAQVPPAASLVVDQQYFGGAPSPVAYHGDWSLPPAKRRQPVWQPIETISTTAFYGATGSPQAFAGTGQVLVAATDLWVFAPTAATIEVSQRGSKIT